MNSGLLSSIAELIAEEQRLRLAERHAAAINSLVYLIPEAFFSVGVASGSRVALDVLRACNIPVVKVDAFASLVVRALCESATSTIGKYLECFALEVTVVPDLGMGWDTVSLCNGIVYAFLNRVLSFEQMEYLTWTMAKPLLAKIYNALLGDALSAMPGVQWQQMLRQIEGRS